MREADKPYRECPRFSRCSVNHCPLGPDKDKRVDLPGEPRCTLGKKRRMAIAAQYPDLLPWKGLRPRELSGMRAWEALPEEEKQRRRQVVALARRAKRCGASLQVGSPVKYVAEGQ